MKEIPESEFSGFKKYINRFSWINAKTYEAFSPHEYILNFPCWKLKEDNKCSNNCEQCKKDRVEFEHCVMFIREYGKELCTVKIFIFVSAVMINITGLAEKN